MSTNYNNNENLSDMSNISNPVANQLVEQNTVSNFDILSPSPYKGTRDFYPSTSIISQSSNISSQEKQDYLFSTISNTLNKLGFNKYSSSVIEDAQAFIAKSGEELGSGQLYGFVDKGGRKIALRPELTLSVARMVANNFDNLRLPLRWYSIDNCFRYERPQKGRSREFWQVEVDIIGAPAGGADLEVLIATVEIFKSLNAPNDSFKLLYNHRGVLDKWIELNNWVTAKSVIFKVLDDWFKLDEADKRVMLETVLTADDTTKIFNTVDKVGEHWEEYIKIANSFEELKLINELLPELYPDYQLEFTPAIIRGQAYYTGMIFECFDTNRSNPRSLFGGGRFDNLLDLYGKQLPAVGFAPGDLPMHHFLENWELYPDFTNISQVKVGIIPLDSSDLKNVFIKAQEVVKGGETYDIDYNYSRSVNKRYETLKKRGCNTVITIGDKQNR